MGLHRNRESVVTYNRFLHIETGASLTMIVNPKGTNVSPGTGAVS